MKLKRLVLVRHAHRNKPFGGIFDNGLSEFGARQALALPGALERELDGCAPLAVLSSPKKRCIETVEPLAAARGLKTAVCEHLGEGGNLERKFDAFLSALAEIDAEAVVACSHGDWIPAFLERYVGRYIHLDKSAYAVLLPKDDSLTQFELVTVTNAQMRET